MVHDIFSKAPNILVMSLFQKRSRSSSPAIERPEEQLRSKSNAPRQPISCTARFAWFAFAALLLSGCFGDRDEKKPVETLPFAGQQVVISVPEDFGLRAGWEAPLNEWQVQAGAKYRLEEFASLATFDAEKNFSDLGPGTIALVPLTQVGELIAAGKASPLPDIARGDEGWQVNDIFLGLQEKIGSRKNQTYFLPIQVPVLVCYYRADLLEAAGRKPPQTWEEYQQLIDQLDQWAPGLSVVEPWSEDFRATMFLARAVSSAQHPSQHSLYFDIETGEPIIDNAAFEKALLGALAAVEKMPPAVKNFSPADCRAEFLAGRAALAIASEPEANLTPHGIEMGRSSLTPEQIAAIPLPGAREVYDNSRKIWEAPPDAAISRVTLTGYSGWGFMAHAGSNREQTAAAWNALRTVAGADLVSGLPTQIVGLCRESQINFAALPAALGGGATPSAATAIAESLRSRRIVAELPLARRQDFRAALSRELAPALSKETTAAQSLSATAAVWRSIINEIGAEQHANHYRQSLGLSPRPSR